MYTFVQQKKLNNYRYSNKDKYDKNTSWLFYESYLSTCDKLNKCTEKRVLRHKAMIDNAIASVRSQIKRGLNADCLNVNMFTFPHGFNMIYAYYVVRYVDWELRQKQKEKSTGVRSLCAQKYWVYSSMIETYEFRDKDKSSQYQAFVEFHSSVLDDGLIKLNLNMSNKAYKNRDKIFTDGFDLVFDSTGIRIRHISEEVVTKRADNSLRQFIMIDNRCNLHSALVDEESSYSLNKDRHEVKALRKFVSTTPFVKKVISKLQSFKNPEKFNQQLESLRPSIRSRVLELLRSTEASKVIICTETNSNRQYSSIQHIFEQEIFRACRKLGIKLCNLSNDRSKIEEMVRKVRSLMITCKPDTLRPSTTEYVRWYEHFYAWLYLTYHRFTPYLTDCNKFVVDDTVDEKNESQLKQSVKYPERPNYYNKVMVLKFYLENPDEGQTPRESWLEGKKFLKRDVRKKAWQYYLDYCRLNELKPIHNENFDDLIPEFFDEYSDLYFMTNIPVVEDTEDSIDWI